MREPLIIVEIDFDFCGQTFGVAPCVAALSPAVKRKCYNSYRTCKDKPHYVKTVLTIRFCEIRSNIPRDMGTVFPVIDDISESSASVNISGTDEKLSAFGERAELKLTLRDFIYHDRLTDKYQTERKSGAAQNDEPGYDPQSRGSFFTKQFARNPYYYGRPVRVIEGWIDSGSFVEKLRRNYVLEEMGIPDERGTVTIKAKDILDLASNDKALCPKPNTGVLLNDLLDVSTSCTLTPAGIGNIEYPTSGWASIGSELMAYTRSGDTITFTGRGVRGTKAANHSAGDTFQMSYSPRNMRIDDLIEDLMTNFGAVPSSMVPKSTKWAPEVNRWAPGVLITTDITKPTGVASLIGELQSLGVIISWDSVAQEVGLRVNRPLYNETFLSISDSDSIKSITADRREDERLTQVVFFTVQQDPTKSLTDYGNYAVVLNRADPEAQSSLEYGSPRIKNIPVRWFNNGINTAVHALAKRMLNRFRDPPTVYDIVMDEKDYGIKLIDVVEVTSSKITDETGKAVPTLLQITKKTETKPGIEFEVRAQAFQYTSKYGSITENSRPDYPSSSPAQKSFGAYFSNAGAPFADGGLTYRFI